jgi:hypothetical protein
MALDMGGGLRMPWTAFPSLPETKTETYRLRPAETADIPDLKPLYAADCARSMISCLRDDADWRFEIEQAHRREGANRRMEVIETAEGQIVGYIALYTFPAPRQINELVLAPAHSLRAVSQFIGRNMKARIEALDMKDTDKPPMLYFALGQGHPVYDALGRNNGNWQNPYAWYVRVPDLRRFLKHIQPVLERRLANSVMVGHSGSLKLNFYTSQLKIDLDVGRITAVEPYQPKDFFDFDIFFPDLTFLQLLFGNRSLKELRHICPDCYPRDTESALLLGILFPRRSSRPINLS